MATITLGVAVVGGSPQPSGAADGATPAATSQPSPPSPGSGIDDRFARPPGRGGDGGFGGRFRFGGGGRPGGAAGRLEAQQFLSQHAPNIAQMIRRLPEGSDERFRMESVVFRAYVAYQRIKTDDPDLFDVITRRVEVEDRIFGLSGTARDNPTDAALRSDLRAQVATWCDLNLQERRLRLARLQRTVQREQDRVAADAAARDRRIDERMGQVLSGASPDGFLPGTRDDGGRRGEGRRGDGGHHGDGGPGDGARGPGDHPDGDAAKPSGP